MVRCGSMGHAKTIFGVYRKKFRESSVLRDFAEKELIHQEIEENQLNDLSRLKGMDFKKSVLPPRKTMELAKCSAYSTNTCCILIRVQDIAS